MSTGFASQQGVYRTRAAAMLLTAAGMGFSAFVGALAGSSALGLLAATIVWGYGYGLVASLGPAATAVGINSVIALVVFSHFRLDPREALIQGAIVCSGGITQTILLVLIWPLRRFSAERHALARAFRSLAAYAREVSGGQLLLPEARSLVAVRQTLADPQPFAQRGEIAVFQALLDEAERIRGSLGALVTDRHHFEQLGNAQQTAALDDLAARAAAVLDEISDALDEARAPSRHAEMLEHLEPSLAPNAAIALTGQLRSTWRLSSVPAGAHSLRIETPKRERTPRRDVLGSLQDTAATLRANLPLSSPFGRLAIRIALALAAATMLELVWKNPHGYWVPLTTVIVLKPDFTTTFARGFGRLGGTLVGAAVSTALAFAVHPGAETYDVLCILFASAGYFIFNANYALFSVAITAYVVFALSLLGQPSATAIGDRIAATLAGGALAAIAYLVRPLWESGLAPQRLAELLEAQRRYARTVFDAYIEPGRRNLRDVRDAQLAGWAARAEAEGSVDRMLGEPAGTHRIAPATALGVLAASRRLGLGILGLSTSLSQAAAVSYGDLAGLRDALDAALAACAEALRAHTAPSPYPSLREAFRASRSALEDSMRAGFSGAEAILAEIDVLIDSTNSVADVLRRAA
ncbi:MAG: FUSC family protein [Candidatus Eremiobacteraeota bacterium]|nr:FUSC family protein [Candidatus Eremiobacteraeota bacterium]MBV8355047.1 FUSC family protein [Candidatus Eremiobacteraeota bacterium]